MTRGTFNTNCDVFSGPDSIVPGIYLGTFDCRLVVEDAINTIGIGSPLIPCYLTILDYVPIGSWTFPFFGLNPGLADQIAVPSGSAIRFWVLYTDEIDWLGQTPYFRAYLVNLPVPATDEQGGVFGNGYATIVVFVLSVGGVVGSGIGIISKTIRVGGIGGALVNSSGALYIQDTFVPSGGALLGGSGIVVPPAKALSFVPASSQCVNMGNVAALDFDYTSAWSVTAWVKTSDSSNYMAIAGKYSWDGATYRGWYVGMIPGGKPWTQIQSGGAGDSENYGPTNIANGAWRFLAFTYSGSGSSAGIKVYVDGVQETNNYYDSGTLGSTTNTYDFLIGARNHSGSPARDLFFNGSIDEVHVYNTVLSAGAITAAYNSGVGVRGTPGESGLVSGWHFDEGSGSSASDYQGSATGTLTNGPTWVAGKI